MKYRHDVRGKVPIKNKFITFVAILALTANSFSTALPALFSTDKAAASSSVHTTDLSTWNLSETRATGHNKLVDGGLRVWTEGNGGTDKAAGYYDAVDFELDDADDFSLVWTGTSPAPGGQLVVDLDNDGAPDGILVVEESYDGIGGSLWLPSIWGSTVNASMMPHEPGGGGYPNQGSLASWNAAFPDAKVLSIGYSLGSGIFGNGIISKISVGDVDYTFDMTLPAPASQTTQTVLQSRFANSMNTWTYQNDNTGVANPGSTANHEIVDNPTPVPGNTGAVRLTTTATGERWNLASLQYSGTKLADIASLGFDLYTDNPGNAYINLDVDFNHPGLSGWQGRLVYVPSGVSNNVWSSHEAVASNGQWMWSQMITNATGAWPDGNTASSRSWKDIVSAFPEAKVTALDNLAFGSLYLRADGVSTTYYDNVYLATTTENIKYNFELPDAKKPVANLVTPAVGNVNPAQIVVEATDETSLYRVTANIYDAANTTLLSSCSQSAGNATSYTLTCPMQNLPDGTYTIRANAQDNASPRHTSNTITRQFTIDHTAPTVPIHESPSDNAVQNFNDFYFEWTDSEGAVEYEFQSATSPDTDGDGALVNGVWNNKLHGGSDRNHLTDSNIHSYGASGTWYWQVRAIDSAGNKSAWTTPWKITIDMTAPVWNTTPVHVSPAELAEFDEGDNILMQWVDASDPNGVKYYYNVSAVNGNTTGDDNHLTEPFYLPFGPLMVSEIDATGTAPGSYWWQVKACDDAGNCTPWTDPWEGSVNGATLGASTDDNTKKRTTRSTVTPVSPTGHTPQVALNDQNVRGDTGDQQNEAPQEGNDEDSEDEVAFDNESQGVAGVSTSTPNSTSAPKQQKSSLSWIWLLPAIGGGGFATYYFAFGTRRDN